MGWFSGRAKNSLNDASKAADDVSIMLQGERMLGRLTNIDDEGSRTDTALQKSNTTSTKDTRSGIAHACAEKFA